MTELLAPAGNMEALRAAVANGCDAVYLGMPRFGARADSCNFDEETLPEAVRYAHLREVKVYVTMNTIVFENELTAMREQLAFLNEIGVDGVIVPMDNEGCAAGIAAVLRDEALRQKLTENTKIRDYTNAGEIEKIYRLLENV